MKQWAEIRLRVLRGESSKRQILRETGMHWSTLEKILKHSEPPGYQLKKERPKPKIGPFLDRISDILESDKDLPKKQRHTAKRIYERIKEEGYQGGYTQVTEAVREIKQQSREVFMPLIHRPGEAQVDFGFALVKVAGLLRQVLFFVMALPYSDAFFVAAFERECTETYWEGHIRAFDFFGGVPRRITYDNSKVLVSKIIGPHDRQLTNAFLQLKSHYLFDHHFCRVRRPNEKGVVEGVVKYARLNFFVPVPQVRDLEELNEKLAGMCQKDLKRRLRGKDMPKSELLIDDQSAFASLPPAPLDACRKQSTTASSLSLVRFDCNDYSVPVRHAHHPIVAKGYVDRVALCYKGELVAEHKRSWGKEGVFFNYVHYLPLLERKPGSLDHALPLADMNLPECFSILHRRLQQEAEREGEGTREYIRVLRLIEDYGAPKVTSAVEKALRVGALTRDAVAQFLIPQPSWDHPTFRLDGREHLRLIQVDGPDISSYQALLSRGGAV
jgi:transposase